MYFVKYDDGISVQQCVLLCPIIMESSSGALLRSERNKEVTWAVLVRILDKDVFIVLYRVVSQCLDQLVYVQG